MENILEISKLNKRYEGFSLSDVDIVLPSGSIMGFIGENGAGKSTTIKLILNLIRRDSGEIRVFGKDNAECEREIKEDIGVVFDECNFPDTMKISDVNRVMDHIYSKWDSDMFIGYANRFSLPANKVLKEFSRGMKTKLSIAAALSHNARLLLLDEATSGLDPIVRDEILEILLEFIQDERNAVLVSTHILSDIEKTADYITFIHKGKIIFSQPKDELLEEYGILKCGHSEFEAVDRTAVKGCRKNEFGVEALVLRDRIRGAKTIDHATLEEIMLFTVREDQQ